MVIVLKKVLKLNLVPQSQNVNLSNRSSQFSLNSKNFQEILNEKQLIRQNLIMI
jgi:hypothetical protein